MAPRYAPSAGVPHMTESIDANAAEAKALFGSELPPGPVTTVLR